MVFGEEEKNASQGSEFKKSQKCFSNRKKKKANFIKDQWARRTVVQDVTGDVNEDGLGDCIKHFGFYLKSNGKSLMNNRRMSYIIRFMLLKNYSGCRMHEGTETINDRINRVQEINRHRINYVQAKETERIDSKTCWTQSQRNSSELNMHGEREQWLTLDKKELSGGSSRILF